MDVHLLAPANVWQFLIPTPFSVHQSYIDIAGQIKRHPKFGNWWFNILTRFHFFILESIHQSQVLMVPSLSLLMLMNWNLCSSTDGSQHLDPHETSHDFSSQGVHAAPPPSTEMFLNPLHSSTVNSIHSVFVKLIMTLVKYTRHLTDYNILQHSPNHH